MEYYNLMPPQNYKLCNIICFTDQYFTYSYIYIFIAKYQLIVCADKTYAYVKGRPIIAISVNCFSRLVLFW